MYSRVEQSNGCFEISTINLTLLEKPTIEIDDQLVYCENEEHLQINAGVGFDKYLWSTGETSQTILVNTTGNYWVEVSNLYKGTLCTTKKTFSVSSTKKPTIDQVYSIDWTQNNNQIEIQTLGSYQNDFEYSINGIDFQSSAIFKNLTPGEYQIIVRNKKGCGDDFIREVLLFYPNFFTPNNDNHNDTWKVYYSELEPEISTEIYDRYGKLILTLGYQDSWDGTYNNSLCGNRYDQSRYDQSKMAAAGIGNQNTVPDLAFMRQGGL